MHRITYVYRGLQGLLRVEGLKTCTGSPTSTEVCKEFCELRDLKRLPVPSKGVEAFLGHLGGSKKGSLGLNII